MDSMQRIVAILVHLSAAPQGISGGELAKICGVAWSTMQKDLAVVAGSYPVYTDADEAEAEDDLSKPEVKWYLVPGYEPYLPISLEVQDTLVLLRALEFVNLSAERTKLEQKITAAFGFAAEPAYRYVKGNMDPIQPIDVELFPLLEAAISERRQLTFVLGERQAWVDPLGIVFYSKLRHWYLIAREEDKIKTFNLQNITAIRLTKRNFIYPIGFEVPTWMAPRWGMEYGEPMAVKVRFTNRSQIFAKVKKDTAHRQTKLTLADDAQTLSMEDTVIGLNEFIAWVLGFGSAAEVLEPPELREAVKARVKNALAVYGL